MTLLSIKHIFWLLEDEIGLDTKKMPIELLDNLIEQLKEHHCKGNNFLANELQMFNPVCSVLKKKSLNNEYTPYRKEIIWPAPN